MSSMSGEEQPTPETLAASEFGKNVQTAEPGPQAVETVCIAEPVLPAHLKDSAGDGERDWNPKALEALAQQLTVANDFYRPLMAAAQELRDLRSVNAALIELLRTVNPNSKPYSRFTHETRSL
jgi:hypothetical protein